LPGSFAAAIFDMDGLIVDSEPLWVSAEAELLSNHGERFTPADEAATHGRSIDETIAAYAERLDGVTHAALRAELIALMRARFGERPSCLPGARELIRSLHGRLPLAVASNTDADLIREVLHDAGLLDAFSAIASGADIGRGKPHPDVYVVACRALGVRPRDAIAFEDSPTGVRAAKAAGLSCVGVPVRDDVDLAAAGADVVVASLADVLGWVTDPG
jgi:HAD superfamily hydrolase (TIGR01509 family)